MLRARIIVIGACAALLCACAGEAGKETLEAHADYFMPADASDIVTAPDIPWVQKSFKVSRKPFQFAVDEEKLTRAKSDGWILCQQLEPEWTSYQDATLTPPRHTRQRAYVLHKGSALVVLVGKYDSDTEFVQESAGPTEKMTQHGMVIVRSATEAEVQETVDSFKLSCS